MARPRQKLYPPMSAKHCFGVLAVTQEQLNNVGATLPRAAYIHFIVPQLIMAIIYLLWTLLNCRRYWRSYPDHQAYLRRVYVNFDERKAGICERKKSCCLLRWLLC